MSPVYKLSANSVKNGRTIYGSMLAGNTAFVSTIEAMDPLQVITVGAAGASSVTFTNIPSTYSHLQVRGIGRNTSTNTNSLMTFNSDSGANYNWHELYGNGSTAAAGSSVGNNFTLAGKIAISSDSANIFGAVVVDILDYANTNKYKTTRVLTGVDTNGSGTLFYNSGLWRNTNAITTIKLDSGGTYAQYSQFALYGIKGA